MKPISGVLWLIHDSQHSFPFFLLLDEFLRKYIILIRSPSTNCPTGGEGPGQEAAWQPRLLIREPWPLFYVGGPDSPRFDHAIGDPPGQLDKLLYPGRTRSKQGSRYWTAA